ncbi:hypothetical protein [Pseudomonas aeruginosa]|uniref:Cap15 family cyclic dinucleotide receptor domain-containing protein n=1 Tax=Pseudomonas aeruginosa TaxID=287 RepID=UPI000F547413|nr:hypothetical protein [Pseudomonas aeruginosa]EIU1413921.1 hypothetical protein [Pseudomonas aeruginosa]MCG9956526.1 hypothetical protein [Pseudomonas aeruginosa]MCS7968623.1 hypothetical protein [Pseudomonas aeruginosa]MCS8135144.1 hypothetical protein [Pseudomonas aeruginosa]MCS8177496.1 hypothetical protein [Pseudomonas aeruginosa]
MYQVLGIQKCLGYFLLLCLLIFGALSFWRLSEVFGGFGAFWSVAKLAAAITSLILLGLGQTPLFPLICALPFVGKLFPPIDGEWQVTVRSNWNVLRQLVGQPAGEMLFAKQGKVVITSRLFSVRMRFQSEDKYSKSTTTIVGVRRDPEHGTFELNYSYHNVTLNPEVTDSSSHYGAARVEVHDENGVVSLEGEYWTNRNWNKGLNTAGLISFVRP